MAVDALCWTRLDHAVDAGRAFAGLFGASPYAFWLDSSLLQGRARYSFLGEGAGVVADDFDTLQARLDESAGVDLGGLPPELACGYVGYFGYELPAYDGARRPHPSPYPDAAWLRADRFLAIDHLERRTWLVERGDTGWTAEAESKLALLPELPPVPPSGGVDPEPLLLRDRAGYLAAVRAWLDYLRATESYEICLTNRVELPFEGDPWTVYRRLRRLEPSPHSAFLRLGDLRVLSASPECFLTVDGAGYATAW